MAGRLSSPAIRKTGPVNMDQTPNINRSIIGTTIGSTGTLKSKGPGLQPGPLAFGFENSEGQAVHVALICLGTQSV